MFDDGLSARSLTLTVIMAFVLDFILLQFFPFRVPLAVLIPHYVIIAGINLALIMVILIPKQIYSIILQEMT